MRFNRGQLVSLVAVALTQLGQSTGAESVPRGVSPEDAHLYAVPEGKTTWKCLKSGQEINASAINDDYCDCDDGTDEPGTSACPDSRFYCNNAGHIPSYILSSRVNDGVCDPDCCDGSDENDGKVKCPDACASIGKAYRKKQQEIENKRRAGSKIRDKYIAEGKKTLEELDAEIVKLEVELEVATEREQRAKQQLQQAESSDRLVIEKKMASPLYATLKSHQESLRALMQRDHSLKDELRKLTHLLDDLSRDYNPNYQDMAVKGAVMAYREWKRGGNPEAASEGEGEDGEGKTVADEEPKKLNDLLDEGEWTKEKLLDIVDKDPLTLLDDDNFKAGSSDDTGILFRIHEYLPDAVVPYFEAAVDTLLDLLLKANVITDVKRKSRRSVEEGEPENVSLARSAHQSAEAALRRITDSLKHKREAAKVAPEKWGPQGEFKALDGKCVEKNFGEYTYEYCFFGRATQKPNRGGGHVSLGRFSRFEPKNSSLTPADPDFFLRQIYDAGQRCWNGPDRSVIVDLACDTENALLDVFEGEKCIYEAKVTTPAVCQPLVESPPAQQHHSAKDEL